MSATETVQDKVECPKCGSDVRPGSMFCYNCGGPIAAVPIAAAESDEDPVDPRPIERATRPAPGMRSAREIRRERVFERKPKEFVWEPNESSSETLLIVVTLAIVVFTITVIVLAFYLR